MKFKSQSRRRFVKSALMALIASVLPGSLFSANKKIKPNIIYILTDDLGYGDLSCYGQEKFKTPNIDRLAEQGMKFIQHYAASPVCAPSRCSLMTGYHTGHAQIRANKEYRPIGQHPLAKGSETISSLLKKAGYKTGMFGKWGLGYPGSSGDPMNQGFDTFFGYNCQRNAHTYYPTRLFSNNEKVKLDGKTYAHDLIMEKAFDFIKLNKNKSFFCYMPVVIPHASMHAPKDKHDKWRKKLPQFEDTIGEYAGPDVKNPVAAFPAMVTHLDDQVGELMKLLTKLGIDKNTLVMFASDNGPHIEGGHDPVFWNSNGPLRGIKRDLYEGGIRVPMIARWPGKIKAGTVSDHLSAFWDILPTMADIAGVNSPKEIDGISLLPTLLSNHTLQKQHKYLYWEFSPQGGKQAIRKGRFKAVKLNVTKNPQAEIELYDLIKDPGETTNIAKRHPKIIREMAELFVQARHESKDFPLFG